MKCLVINLREVQQMHKCNMWPQAYKIILGPCSQCFYQLMLWNVHRTPLSMQLGFNVNIRAVIIIIDKVDRTVYLYQIHEY